jgi:hypothetical protein
VTNGASHGICVPDVRLGNWPPKGHGRHRYIFAVLALGAERIEIDRGDARLLMFNLFGTLGRAFLEAGTRGRPALPSAQLRGAGRRDRSRLSGRVSGPFRDARFGMTPTRGVSSAEARRYDVPCSDRGPAARAAA